jgi:hypothetical protein
MAEVGARLRLTPGQAALLVMMAIALTTRLKATMEALWAGRLTPYMAQLVVELVAPMADHEYAQQIADGASPAEAEAAATAVAGQVEARILGRA